MNSAAKALAAYKAPSGLTRLDMHQRRSRRTRQPRQIASGMTMEEFFVLRGIGRRPRKRDWSMSCLIRLQIRAFSDRIDLDQSERIEQGL